MLAFLSILATALAAFAGAPLWTMLIGAGVLVTISLSEQRKLAGRFEAIGARHVLVYAAWQSGFDALVATVAAFALGWALRTVIMHLTIV